MSWVHQLEEQDRLIPPPSPLTCNQGSPSPIVEDDPMETEAHSAPPSSQPFPPQRQAPMMEQVTTEQMLQLMQQMQQQILNLQQQNQVLLGHLPAQQTGHAAPAYIPTPKKVKVPTPDIFDGKRDKCQDPLLQRKTMKLEEVSNLPTRREGSLMTQTWYETREESRG